MKLISRGLFRFFMVLLEMRLPSMFVLVDNSLCLVKNNSRPKVNKPKGLNVSNSDQMADRHMIGHDG